METDVLWGIIAGGMLVTYVTRLSFIALVPYERLPEFFRSCLRYVPPSILAALILPELLCASGQLDFSFGNHRLLAGTLAALIAWRTGNSWLTIAIGMLTLWWLSST